MDRPQRAAPAPCNPPSHVVTAGNMKIEGDPTPGGGGSPSCADSDEELVVFCTGTIKVFYAVNGAPQGTVDTTVACAAPTSFTVLGHGGDDGLNLASVTAANGFTGISQASTILAGSGADSVVGSSFADSILGEAGNDLLDGGPGSDAVGGGAGSDILKLRDGTADTADCGSELDAAQTDQRSLDSLANCEIVDALPTPPAASPAATSAKKKCKRKKHSKKKCRKHKNR